MTSASNEPSHERIVALRDRSGTFYVFSEAQIQAARATPAEQAALEQAAREPVSEGDVAGFNQPSGQPAPAGTVYVHDLATMFVHTLPLLTGPSVDSRPRLSADGSFIVFISNR
jgi:hypothetical protein